MAFCTKCGKEIQEGDGFCHACGAPIGKAGQAAAVPIPPGSTTVQPGTVPMPPAAAGGKTQEQLLEERVERRLKDRSDLIYHIGAYVIVNAFIIVVWALSGAGYPWFIWCLVPWGFGLAIHIFVYLISARSESAKQRMIEKEMEKLTGLQTPSGEGQGPEQGQT